MSRIGRFTIRLLLALQVAGLSGCVYFNTFYNAEKAYGQALRLREKRLDKNPEDSVLASPDEKSKLDRCIAKCSKVLEIYPDKKKYQPKALFLIGESYMALGEYGKAITKYEELARFYPQAGEIPVAEFHRAKALFLNGQYPFARTALERVIAGSGDPEHKAEAMAYLAQLEVKNNSPALALDLYEKLLRQKARAPEAKANVRFEAAKLAYEIKAWERARGHAKAPEIGRLPSRLRYRCDMLAADCLYKLGADRRPAGPTVQDGIGELEAMLKNRLYAAFAPEIDLKLAEGWFLLAKPGEALALLQGIPAKAPKSEHSAEAFFRLGEYHLRELKDEKRAKVFFDSAAAAGIQFKYGLMAQERSDALGRIADLRKSPDTAAHAEHYRDFMIAELFLFRLDNVDSALSRLDRIVADRRRDSTHSMRAAYARAFIQQEFKQSKPAGDSLYKYVLETFPGTEYAKQAERNMGLKPTVQTDEDQAHGLFLEAEALRFGGGSLADAVAAYRRVVQEFPKTREAAKAQFVVAMLFNQAAFGEEKLAGAQDSAKQAFLAVRDRHPQTPYAAVAERKLIAAGINSAAPPAKPAAPPKIEQKAQEGEREVLETDEHEVPEGIVPEGTPSDTGSYQPEGKTKEELEKDYENVDQY